LLIAFNCGVEGVKGYLLNRNGRKISLSWSSPRLAGWWRIASVRLIHEDLHSGVSAVASENGK
jgi:hypothetical protein